MNRTMTDVTQMTNYELLRDLQKMLKPLLRWGDRDETDEIINELISRELQNDKCKKVEASE